MSFWSKLFGGGGDGGGDAPAAGGPSEEYKGFIIRAAMLKAGSEFQLAGSVEKDVGGTLKRHDFVRADRFSSRDEAQSATIRKGQQIIDEQGERLFDQSWPAKSN